MNPAASPNDQPKRQLANDRQRMAAERTTCAWAVLGAALTHCRLRAANERNEAGTHG
jgi:hypothetical protein